MENREIVENFPGNIADDEFSNTENNENVNETSNQPDSLTKVVEKHTVIESCFVLLKMFVV